MDDISGLGMWRGSISQSKFGKWVGSLCSQMIATYSSDIIYNVRPISELIQFLDRERKAAGGRLTTDLSREPTDDMITDVSSSQFSILDIPSDFIVFSQAL